MENTDDLIKNITGSNDYMKELEKVTGNIESIDVKYFMKKNEANIAHDAVIRSGMKALNNDETKNYFTLSIENDFNKALVTKKNKRKSKKVDDKFKAKVFIKSPFFKLIKKIEKTCNMLFEAYNISKQEPSIKPVIETLKTNPELMEVKNFFGYKLSTDDDIKTLVKIQESTHGIIHNYMLPMYDVKSTMDKNWGILAPMFKVDGGIPISEVKDMLYLFIIAKYRCAITDNTKHYMKLFMDVINKSTTGSSDGLPEENVIAEMDPARFLELLDNINFDSISEKKSVFEFATKSKDIIRRIAHRKPDEKMEDIIADIQNVLRKPDEETTAEETSLESTEPAVTENEDILANI